MLDIIPRCPKCGCEELTVACHTMYKLSEGVFGDAVTDGPYENLEDGSKTVCTLCCYLGQFKEFEKAANIREGLEKLLEKRCSNRSMDDASDRKAVALEIFKHLDIIIEEARSKSIDNSTDWEEAAKWAISGAIGNLDWRLSESIVIVSDGLQEYECGSLKYLLDKLCVIGETAWNKEVPYDGSGPVFDIKDFICVREMLTEQCADVLKDIGWID